MRAKRVRTANWVPDGEVDELARRIKREHDSDGQTVNDKPDLFKSTLIQNERTAFGCYDFNDLVRKNQSRMKEEGGSRGGGHSPMVAPEENDQEAELSPESSNDISANLKLVYDVEYRAPD